MGDELEHYNVTLKDLQRVSKEMQKQDLMLVKAMAIGLALVFVIIFTLVFINMEG